MSRFSVEIVLPYSTEELRRGTLLCFTKILVSKKFMDKGGGGGKKNQNFPWNIFVSQCQKNS